MGYVALRELAPGETVARTHDCGPLLLDFDAQGKLIGAEFFQFSRWQAALAEAEELGEG
ncbi:hypothetical protein Deipr_1606 [Deinococcus proteolyticus MRP]|uniref:DUF2283 domain-containing protein n=1 Tax=Deinococcus proteolyticus (strain ATCC 35074 / DSM 20540 / JCM 6276 / NBRC 101906 / NCIMB 13154 / VKM Ac-1939 / CCM 2703 / MRP) TaxID=693977 RepID=F0RKG5_DEIPM|nr:hypothetical protein [Deinococcus sp. SL84]ADY26744.1 hypothetical protein Deipr_1606 [Deinococcus proteolyticus MRP]